MLLLKCPLMMKQTTSIPYAYIQHKIGAQDTNKVIGAGILEVTSLNILNGLISKTATPILVISPHLHPTQKQRP